MEGSGLLGPRADLRLEVQFSAEESRTLAAMAALAMDLMEKVADSQNARNACFPEAVSSPIVGILLLATTAAINQWMRDENNPIQSLGLTLVQMMAELDPLAAESMAALAEGDFQWCQGSSHPTSQETLQAANDLAAELEAATEPITRWRLAQGREPGLKHDRKLLSVILCIEEMKYYDLFPTLDVIQRALKGYQLRIQTKLLTQHNVADMDQSQ